MAVLDTNSLSHYKIQTEGLHLGPYFLTLRTLDERGRPQTVASLPGIANVGSSSTFEVRYEASPRTRSELAVVASFASARADVSNAQKSGMLVGRELATTLTDLLNAAQQASYGADRRHEREEAFALKVFEEVVRFERGRHLHGVAPTVLTNDVESLERQAHRGEED